MEKHSSVSGGTQIYYYRGSKMFLYRASLSLEVTAPSPTALKTLLTRPQDCQQSSAPLRMQRVDTPVSLETYYGDIFPLICQDFIELF